MKFDEHILAIKRINLLMLIDPMAFPLAPSSGQTFHFQPHCQQGSKKEKKIMYQFDVLQYVFLFCPILLECNEHCRLQQPLVAFRLYILNTTNNTVNSLSCLLCHRWYAIYCTVLHYIIFLSFFFPVQGMCVVSSSLQPNIPNVSCNS